MNEIKVLIVDTEKWVANGISNLINIQENMSAEKAITYEEGMFKFSLNKYDFIVVDFTSNDANKLH